MFSIKIATPVSVAPATQFVMESVDLNLLIEKFTLKMVREYFHRQLTGGQARSVEKYAETIMNDGFNRFDLYTELDRIQDSLQQIRS